MVHNKKSPELSGQFYDLRTSFIRTVPSVPEFHRISFRSRTLPPIGNWLSPHPAPKYSVYLLSILRLSVYSVNDVPDFTAVQTIAERLFDLDIDAADDSVGVDLREDLQRFFGNTAEYGIAGIQGIDFRGGLFSHFCFG